MNRIKKHAVTVIVIVIVIAVALLIWSRKAVASEPLTCAAPETYICA
jgi:hypothetical protein